jgi:hypothetical protein
MRAMPGQTKTVDIDQLIEELPRDERLIVNRLRGLVRECIPEATEKAYAGIAMPFYSRNRLICYILPPSVSLEPGIIRENRKAKGVLLGFNQGNLMANERGLLRAEGRKQVYTIYFTNQDEVNEGDLRPLLYEALMIDGQFDKRTKRK